MGWREEFWKSIKSYDTEEKLDLFFYRPFGFLIAKAALPLGLTPTQLTIIGLMLGLTTGFYYHDNASLQSLLTGSFLFIMAGVFDSADGQLARMGGKSTKIGLVLDGLCDNLVFGSAYVGGILTITHLYDPWVIWPLAVFAGFCHSCQSSLLDFYNREYLYFGYGRVNGDYWNPTLPEARKDKAEARDFSDRFFWALRFSWIWQQNVLCNRSDSLRMRMKAALAGAGSTSFQDIYRDHNRTMIRFWRLMGPNFHTIMIIACVFLRRFDYYIIGVDIIGLTLILFALRAVQGSLDRKLEAEMKRLGIA